MVEEEVNKTTSALIVLANSLRVISHPKNTQIRSSKGY
jgi:hypothetical protein